MHIFLFLCIWLCYHDIDNHTKTTGQKAESRCETFVAQNSQWASGGYGSYTTLDPVDLGTSPLTRFAFSTPSSSYSTIVEDVEFKAELDGRKRSEPGLEVCPVQTNEQEACHLLSNVWQPLGKMCANIGLGMGRRQLGKTKKPETSQLQCKTENQPKGSRQKPSQERHWRQERSRIQRKGCKGCSIAICPRYLLAFWFNNTLASHGLLTIPSSCAGSHDTIYGNNPTSDSSSTITWSTRTGSGTEEGVSRFQLNASWNSRSFGSHGSQRSQTDQEGATCSDYSAWQGTTCPPGGCGVQEAASFVMAPSPGRECQTLGSSSGALQVPHGPTSRPGSKGPSRSCHGAENNSTIECARSQGPDHGRATGYGSGRPHCSGCGGGIAPQTGSGHHEAVSAGNRWRDPRNFGRRKGHRSKEKETQIYRSFGSCCGCNDFVSQGRIRSCLRKDGCRGPRIVRFGDVEAYLQHLCCQDAACDTIRQCMSTDDVGLHQHSVTQEFDYVSPFSAALRACAMRWDTASSSLGLDGYEGFHFDQRQNPHFDVFGGPLGDDWQDQFLPADEGQCIQDQMDPMTRMAASRSLGLGCFEGFPSIQHCKPDEDQEGDSKVIEWLDQFRHPRHMQRDPRHPEPRYGARFQIAPAVETETGDSHLMNVVSYGYHGGFVGKRELSAIPTRSTDWKSRVRHQWRDHWTTLMPTIHIVREPPEDRNNTVWVTVQCDLVQDDVRSILVKAETEIDYKVITVTSPSLCSHILVASGVPLELHAAAVARLGQLPWLLGIPKEVNDGDVVCISLPEHAVNSCRLLDDRPTARSSTSQEQSDEQPPDPHQEDEGHTDFYPHHDWIPLFHDNDGQDESQSRFTIYGLAEESCGTRAVVVRQPTPASLNHAVRQQFPAFRQWHLRIHMVHPQPSDDAASTHVLAEFTPPGARLNPLQIPVVDDLKQFDPHEQVHAHRFATYRMSPTTQGMLLQPHRQLCPDDDQQHCLIWCREMPLHHGGQASLHRGDLITIRILPHGSSLSSLPAIGNVERLYEHIVDVVRASQLSSIHLYFHTIDEQTSTFSISEFHPGILGDLCAHAQFLWGLNAAIRLGTFTSSSPHNVHFVIGSQTMDGNIALVAISTTAADGQPLCAFRAVVLPLWCSVTDLAHQLGLSSMTSRFRDLNYNSEPWHGAPLQLHDHSFFEVTIPVDVFTPFLDYVVEEDSETDASSMMQSSSSGTPATSLVTITLRGMHRRLHTFELPLGQGLFEYLDQNWPFQALSHSDMVALHVVASPPSYVNQATEQLYLVECDSDRFEQVHVDDVLILVTIKYFIPGTSWERDKVRTKVVWGPKRASRDGILHFLRMQWFCRQSTITCELFFNEMAWSPTDALIHHFQSGDHIRLNILSTQEQWCAFEYAEQADRGRFFFESSPSDTPAVQEDQEEESLSPYTIRERSRSRTRSPSLLQKQATVRSAHTNQDAPTLTLDDKIAPPVWMRIPCGDLRFLRTQLLDVDLGPVLDRRQVVKWHDSTLAAFDSTPDWKGELVTKYSLFTDGSSIRTTDGRVGSSAIVLLVHTPHGLRFGGIRAYSVPVQQLRVLKLWQWCLLCYGRTNWDIYIHHIRNSMSSLGMIALWLGRSQLVSGLFEATLMSK